MDKYCPLKVALLGSGTGTSIAAVCNAVKYNLLHVNVNCIVTNNKNLVMEITKSIVSLKYKWIKY